VSPGRVLATIEKPFDEEGSMGFVWWHSNLWWESYGFLKFL